MKRSHRKFTPEERLSIIQEVQREGTVEVSRKYNIAPSLLSKWKQRYLNSGVDGLKPQHKKIDPQIRLLEQENERLRRIIANQALELEVKTELLKKTPIGFKKK
jgi:transposase-like protein